MRGKIYDLPPSLRLGMENGQSVLLLHSATGREVAFYGVERQGRWNWYAWTRSESQSGYWLLIAEGSTSKGWLQALRNAKRRAERYLEEQG